MSLEQGQEIRFKTEVTKAIVLLNAESKKLSINNIAKYARYSRKEIELNLYEIGLICEQVESDS